MAGLFDDLMPSTSTSGGLFDDLVPAKREEEASSWWDTAKNVAAGVGERIGDATGGLVRGVAGIAEAGGDFMDRNVGTLVKDKDGYTWRRLTEEEAAQPSSVTTLGNKAAGASEAVDFGYEPGTTWEQVKGSPLKNFIPFAIEQGLVSTPDMVAAVAALPAYVVARTGELGQERAQNDGVGNARVEDLIKVLPAAAASALLERLGAKGMFGLDDAVGGVLARGVKAGAKEAGTEAAQEAGEYAATTVGTEKGFDPVEMADRAAAGAVAGGVYGAGAGAVSATGQKLFKSGDEVVFNDGPAGEEAAGPYHGKKAKVGESFTDANGQTRYEVTFEDGQKAFPTEELLVKPERPTLAGDAPTAAPGNLFGDLVPADKPATVTPAQREEMVAPPPTVDRERLDSPRLTPADRASPIPNDLIDDGKALIERAIAGERLAPATSEPLSTGKAENPQPEVSGPPSASPIERAILRKAGSADDEIDVMSREERAADMRQAMDAGVSTTAQDVADAETYQRAAPEAVQTREPVNVAQPGPAVEPVPETRRAVQDGSGRDIPIGGGELPAKGLAVANQYEDGKVYIGKPGEAHFAVHDRYSHAERGDPRTDGFVTPDGKFLNRAEALEWVNANEKRVRPADNMRGELDALDYRDQVPEARKASTSKVERSPIARRDMERDTAVTSAGRQVPVQYAVVEAKSLLASQTDEGRANADYPAELQPRDRSRGVSQTQIQSISSNINPRLLDKSPRASDGAPIIAADGTVESGNGRVLALRKAYSEGGAEGYRQHLASQGYPVDGMSEPVLVRVREGQMAPVDRQAFTREANERDTLAMSSTEQAMADATAMSDGVLGLYRGGDIDAASNREFVRAYIKDVVGQNDQARMIGADGALSQEAVRRVQTGLLGKAYADPDLVASLSESTETNIKAIGGAMTDVSAEWAQMRAESKAGKISPTIDPTPHLLEAARIVQRDRKEGRNINEFVGQKDIFSGSSVDPAAELFLRLMYRNQNSWTQPVSREKLADALRFFAQEARKTTPGTDLLGESAPAPEQILSKAKERQDRQYGSEPAQEGLALRPADNPAPGKDVRPDGGKRAVEAERGQPAEGRTEGARAGDKDAGEVEPSFLRNFTAEQRAAFDKAVPANRDIALMLGAKIDQIVASGDKGRAAKLQSKLDDILKAIMPAKPGQEAPSGPLRTERTRAPITRDIAMRAMKLLDEGFEWDAAVEEARHRALGGKPRSAPARPAPEPEPDHFAAVAKDLPKGYSFRAKDGETSLIGPDGKRISATEGKSLAMAESMVQAAKDHAKRFGEKPAASLREKPTAYHIRETVGDVTTEFVLTDKFRDQAEALTEKLRAALDKAGLKDIGLRVSESIRMIVDGKAAEADGRYFRKTIDIALDAADPISTLNHESIHALRRLGLFSTSEWSILSSKSKREWVKRYNIEDRYEGFPDWAQVEEGIAHAYADWAKGEKTSSLVGRVFERVQTFVEALRNALKGMGFKSADSIFKQVSEGETGERSRDQFGRFASDPMYQAAWHGSPHTFDKFSTDYMGTGEGAQAFGWGLYFAGRKEVAEHYRETLSDPILYIDGRPYDGPTAVAKNAPTQDIALATAHAYFGNVDAAIGALEKDGNKRAADWLRNAKRDGRVEVKGTGRLFKVDVPEDSELLDWDKGISRQPPGIQEKLATVYEDADPASDDYDANEPFQTVYYRLVQKFGSERGVSEALRAAGIPGHKFLDGGSRSKGDGSYNYVIYDDSRISVEAMFSLAERTGGIADQQKIPRVNAITASLGNRIMQTIKRGKNDGESVGDYTHRMLIDYLQSLKVMIEKAGGAPQDTMDAYLQARLAEDASLARIQSIHDSHVTPMIDVLAKAGATLEDLHRYAYALHAEERNRVVGLRNEPDSDFYKAVTDPSVKGASGWSTNEAKAAIRELQQDKTKFAGLMKARTYLRAIVDQNLLDQKKAGLISAETFDSLTQQWQNYVPLRNEEADGDGLPGRGRGFDVRGNEFKAATGRYSEAENVVAWTIAAAERTQLRAGKNAVGKAMLRFINHVDPKGETIAKVYWTGDEGFGDIEKAPTVYRRELDKDGKVVNRKVPPSTISPDMFSAKVGGKAFYIKFADEKVGMALKKMGQTDLNLAFRILRKASVWQSIINTRLNPVFAPINILRDAQAATVHMLDDKFGAAGTAKALASVPQAWGALWRNTRGKKGDSEWDKVAAEYKASGGKISFDSNFNSIEDSLKALRKQVAAASRKKGGIVQTWKAFTKFVGDLNDTAENGIRLAAFKAARDKGMTPQRAAFLARDLTVDFKKHGEYGPSMNAYSAFFNASIQGSYNVGKRVLLSKTARRVAGGLILQGILVDMMNRAFSGDDDDGESYYSKLVRNEGYKLERQVVLFYGSGKGDYVSFPLPYGYNALYHLGLQIGATANGDVDPLEAIGNAARVTFDAYNPLGSGGSVVTMLSPTLVDPLIELGENRNFAGAPITPTRYPGDFEPDSQKKFSTNPEIMQMLAEGLNAATGGNDIEPGMIDVSPETIEHLWNYVSGGIGRFIGQSVDTATKLASGEDIEAGSVPFARSFMGEVGDDSKRGEYYRQREQVQAAKDYLKAYQERGDQDGLAEFIDRNKVAVDSIGAFDGAEKGLRKIRKGKRAIEGDDSLSAADKKERLKPLEEAELSLMTQARLAYARARKASAE